MCLWSLSLLFFTLIISCIASTQTYIPTYKCSERRKKFEEFILYEKRRMDGFRVKETREVMSLEELKERVDTIDELYEIIEVSCATRQVRQSLI